MCSEICYLFGASSRKELNHWDVSLKEPNQVSTIAKEIRDIFWRNALPDHSCDRLVLILKGFLEFW